MGGIWLQDYVNRSTAPHRIPPPASSSRLIHTKAAGAGEQWIDTRHGQPRSVSNVGVAYPDMTYQMTTPFDAEKYYRDKNNNVYFIIGYTATIKEAATDADEDISVTTYDVHKYNSCGKKLGTLSLRPLQGLDANGDVEYEYGEPLVAYNGDIYTWRRNA